MKKILITGITGFAGSFLGQELSSDSENEIYGTYISESQFSNIAAIKDKLHLQRLDLLEKDNVSDYIQKVKPDVVFHLAALTVPGASFDSPTEFFTNNINAQVNILEAMRKANLAGSKILIISSADIYGKVSPADLPIDEQTQLLPTNPYAVSKITQDFLGLQYFLSYGMRVIRVRPFNHIGPRQSPSFVVAAFSKQIAEIEKYKKEPVLLVGNLESERDFTDVRDMVKAYGLAIEKGKAGDVYNIGSGTSSKISKILEMLLSLSTIKIEVQTDPSRMRPRDDPKLVCDNRKFSVLTGWKPTVSLEQTLKDTLDYWREII